MTKEQLIEKLEQLITIEDSIQQNLELQNIITDLRSRFTEVVYNKCYGGFNISQEAMQWLLDHGFKSHEYSMYPLDRYKFFDPVIQRHNPLLIQCVKELGKKANGLFCDLDIAKIDSNAYQIIDHDGKEYVHPIYLDDQTHF